MARFSSCICVLALLLAAATKASAISGYHVKEIVVRKYNGNNDCGRTCKLLGSSWRKIDGGNYDTALCSYGTYFGVITAPPAAAKFTCVVPYHNGYPNIGQFYGSYNCLCIDNASKFSWVSGVKTCPRTFPYPVKWINTVCRYQSGSRFWLGYLNGNYCKGAYGLKQKSAYYTGAAILCSKP